MSHPKNLMRQKPYSATEGLFGGFPQRYSGVNTIFYIHKIY